MNKDVQELLKLLMELRELYDFMINPFIPVISLHAKRLKNEDKSDSEKRGNKSLVKNVEASCDSHEEVRGVERLKENLIKSREEIGRSLLLKSSDLIYGSPIYQCRCLSFLLGDKARETLDALNESNLIESNVYKSLIGKLEMIQRGKKTPSLLSLVLSTYLLKSKINESFLIVTYSLFSKYIQRVGFDNERG